MKLRDVRFITSALSEEVGWTWPSLLTRSLIKSRSIFRSTPWARESGAESEYAKRLSVTAALYQYLVERVGKERAFEIMRKILVAGSVAEIQDDLALPGIADRTGMDQLNALWARYDNGTGIGQVNRGIFIEQSSDVMRYAVTDCFFARFFLEVGTPELAKALCESDQVFYSEAFPEFEFHRGSSWENTIAYGSERCEYVFERKK